MLLTGHPLACFEGIPEFGREFLGPTFWLLAGVGHEIAPNAVANATKIIMLASKIQKLVAKLATRTSAILHFPNVMLYIVKCKPPFWLHRYFKSKLGKPFHLTLQYNEFFQLSFFLMAPNFLALATTLENLGARWLLAKKVNFVPCGGHIAHPFS